MEHKLELIDVKKKYGKMYALKGINYVFNNGIYGIVGPNGAGKTTMMGIVATSIKLSGGKVVFDGKEIDSDKQYRKKIAYVPQQQKMFEEFTGNQFLGYFAALKGMKGRMVKKRIAEVLEQVNLSDVANKRIKNYSGGMKQRILIAQALLMDFDILILDEPTVGLDPEERARFMELIKGFSREKIVILSTHIISDVESVADKTVYMNKGELTEVEMV